MLELVLSAVLDHEDDETAKNEHENHQDEFGNQ